MLAFEDRSRIIYRFDLPILRQNLNFDAENHGSELVYNARSVRTAIMSIRNQDLSFHMGREFYGFYGNLNPARLLSPNECCVEARINSRNILTSNLTAVHSRNQGFVSAFNNMLRQQSRIVFRLQLNAGLRVNARGNAAAAAAAANTGGVARNNSTCSCVGVYFTPTHYGNPIFANGLNVGGWGQQEFIQMN
jgi:hypothetical protein